MAAIATTTAVGVGALPALRAAATPRRTLLGRRDDFPVALARHGRGLELFESPGEVLATVLAYLVEARGIDLARSSHAAVAAAIGSARGSTYLILGEEHRALLPSLADAPVSPVELARFFNRFNRATEGEQVGQAMLEGLRFLRRAIESTGPDTVVLLGIV